MAFSRHSLIHLLLELRSEHHKAKTITRNRRKFKLHPTHCTNSLFIHSKMLSITLDSFEQVVAVRLFAARTIESSRSSIDSIGSFSDDDNVVDGQRFIVSFCKFRKSALRLVIRKSKLSNRETTDSILSISSCTYRWFVAKNRNICA